MFTRNATAAEEMVSHYLTQFTYIRTHPFSSPPSTLDLCIRLLVSVFWLRTYNCWNGCKSMCLQEYVRANYSLLLLLIYGNKINRSWHRNANWLMIASGFP